MASFPITSPTENQVFYRLAGTGNPVPIAVKGTWANSSLTHNGIEYEHTVSSIKAQLGAGTTVQATMQGDDKKGTWSLSLNASLGENQTLTVTATIINTTTYPDGTTSSGQSTSSDTRVISVRELAFQFVFPQAGQVVGIGEDGTTWVQNNPGNWSPAQIRFKLSDPLLAGSVTWQIDSTKGGARRDSNDPTLWYVDTQMVPNRLGTLRFSVSAGGLQDSITFQAADFTPPKFGITFPPDGHVQPDGQALVVYGWANDNQSGVASLEWRLDGGAFQPIAAPRNWGDWSFTLAGLKAGLHSVVIQLKDQSGNPTNPNTPAAIVTFEVAEVYRPQDANDLVSLRAYLEDLLHFAHNHVNIRFPDLNAQVDTPELERIFRQPFEKLADARIPLGQEPVNQLRAVIEVMRRYLTSLQLPPQPAQLAASWPFDEGSGTTAQDASGKDHLLTLKDTLWTVGRSGSTLTFNGVDDAVIVPASASLAAITNSFTIAFWVRPDPQKDIGAETERNSGTTGTGNQRYVWGPQQGGTIYGSADHAGVGISMGANGLIVYEHSDYYLPPLLVYQPAEWNKPGGERISTWIHVTVVYQDGQPRLYLNGELVRTGLKSPRSFVHACPEALGGINYGHYQGQLDDVRIYDKPLLDAEVAMLASVRIAARTAIRSHVTESDYGQAMYEAVLGRVGTSYEEIRLVRGAAQEVRAALAERLGITLDPINDQLDRLYLKPNQVTEVNLEQLFGVPDTHRDPLTKGPDALLYLWQREHLREMWKQQDREIYSVKDAEQPIIDPDFVGQANLRLAQAGNPAFDIWIDRKDNWLSPHLRSLKQQYDASLTAENNLEKLLEHAVSHTLADFDRLVQKAKDGSNIDTDLQGWKLDLRAFRRLARLRTLAAKNAITDAEWDDMYSILLQAMKRGQYKQWRAAEEAKGITLSPDYFVVADVMPELPAWRATYEQYLAWQDRLQSRIDQDANLKDAQAAALVASDQLALPVLRDALVSDWASRLGVHPSDTAEFFTARLLVDIKVSGSQQTTRMLQAIETVQNLLFALRTEQMPPGHPAAHWKLAYLKQDTGGVKQIVQCEPTHFAGEWQWMSSYDAWRGAMLVFFFPENLLLPSLRPASEQTQAFREFTAAVRARSRLSRQDARAAVQAYQRTICGLVVHLPIDEGQGSAAEDASENDNRAILNSGATWLKDEIAGSIGLAENAYLEIAHSDSSLLLGKDDADFSVSFQFYLREGFTHQWRAVMHKGKDDTERTFAIWMKPEDNRLHYRISTTSNSNDGGDSKAEIALNSWTLVEYRKVGRQLQLYLNGVLDSEVTLGAAVVANQSPIYIGRPQWRQSYPSDLCKAASCAIKNVRIYNYGVATAQVAFTDEHTDDELSTLQTQCRTLFESYLTRGKQVPFHLRELFYFVPLEVALRLQRGREFAAALDWLETIYAYRLPVPSRKIYRGLALEHNQGDLPDRRTHWLLEALNPHTIAALRTTSNPYTRFTLMSLARCFLEYADAEFTTDTGASLARARGLYLAARELLLLPDLDPPTANTSASIVLPNPILEALRLRVELQLAKLRQGRNIAGMKRQVELPSSQPTTSGLPQIGSGGQLVIPGATQQLRPTPYYFRVLLERSKQLTGIAQQMEAAFLAAMEKRDKENYDLMQAGYGLQLAQAGEELQKRRKSEAEKGTTLAELQRDRAKIQQDKYQEWIDAGLNEWEAVMIASYTTAGVAQIVAVAANAVGQIAQANASAAGPTGAAAAPFVATASTAYTVGAVASGIGIAANTTAQIASIMASQERRKQEWDLQKSLADQDWKIGDQQHTIALQHEQVVQQEGEIARIQANEAQAVANYLARKFTNAELYDWMSQVLGEVYSYFLQQATSTAQLAQNQLAFERQESASGFIQADYWQPPSEGGAASQKAPDRQGLTGSARLLEDITKLDQFAFETDKRKLNLMQTFSLAQLAPFEFNRFRQSGVLPFATPTVLFDQGFPGHYLRLIKRVRASVVALIPPNQGIRATLIAGGVSRVVAGGDVFQETVIRRDPELVALTSPVNATGVFELDTQSEMLLPFEAMGVDTTWEFQMPRAANPFDFNTIADVLVTIEYTALNSFDYRQQVIQRLKPKISADRAFSLRDNFPDQWYDLNNPGDPNGPLTVSFEISRGDFPPNLDKVETQHILLNFVHSSDSEDGSDWKDLDLQTTLSITAGKSSTPVYAATPTEGTISTRRANGLEWVNLTGSGKSPAGKWTLTLPKEEAKAYFAAGRIQDILFIITFAGRTPPWPG